MPVVYHESKDPSRILNTTAPSLADAIFTNGYGDPVFATQTRGCTTELLSVESAIKTLYPVAIISWPDCEENEPMITALEARKMPDGSTSAVRHISASAHTAHWYHTTISPRKDVYERLATEVDTDRVLRATVVRQKRGILSWKEITCEFRLFPNAFLREDIDVMLAGLLLLMRPRDWKTHQSQLTRAQLESCIAVTQLRMDQEKSDEVSGLTGRDDDEILV
ncbi:uncharacterized protein EI90DRAFT_3119387 [Cantharellus anzutake]|uniref:uncharacterized protein n=1 Tax=Cantharellus anzutake TaxID=1750568 RepID=UPI0019039251|nr:uncharacterized protein EI90DRAFT_3119387 [Cantharellus anzutake]KAF8337059.1 hypothetical protein EI90DRAFT_3119387 [Cantharellus anzutake]